jgi:DNA-directed RNA polymerase specialized sigma24 family protein
MMAASLDWAARGLADADEVLLDRTRRGDPVAFAALATRYWNSVHRLGWSMLSDAAATAQIAEATFLSLLRTGDAFPPDVPFRTSLFRVVLGEAWRRRSAPRSARGPVWAERLVEHRVREGLQRLDVLDRAAFVLQVIESLSSEEAGAILGIAPDSIRQRAHRATLVMTSLLEHAFALR